MPKAKHTNMRIPPQNIESEKALLGSILIRPLAIVDIVDMFNSEDFYIDKHRTIFDMMIDLYRKGEPIDTLSLSSRLKERNLLDGIGGTLYLTDLTSSVPSSANAEYYAEIISNKSALRKLIEAGHTISEFGFNEQEDVEDILDNAEKTVFAVTQSPKSHQFSSMKEILPGVWDTIERLHEHTGELRGIPTGFK